MANEKKRIEEIYHLALEKKNKKERSAYLDSACGDDTKLRASVEGLLQAHDKAGNFLEVPPFDPDVTLDSSPLTEGPGTTIGNYKLLEQIGEGGMAIVYMAEQVKPLRRRVALKIIKLGMDTKSVIARFEVERQALAVMDHPNIAKVFDAGTTETGRPYFVMELVRGVSISKYCDKNKLDTKERLDLFVQVCNAVQHAHQKGIIHRDIKPSNVMVTMRDGKPMPKVIDFGIAKATSQRLTEKTLFTRYAQMIGTPAYMSPEQAEFSEFDIDTRTDIYSLGVLLYELLTGTTPFSEEQLREAGYLEMQRIIREEEPLKPSTKLSTLGDTLTDVAEHRKASPDLLQKLVRGDLDWIVMKSLEKDRTRRYETASELARDIERHICDEPVEASPPSAIYRIRKFVRKRRAVVALTVTVVAALVAMVVFWAIAEKRVKAQKLLRDLELAEQYLNESRFDLALGLGLSAQQRFPDDPRVLKTVRRAKGTAKLSVKFELGKVRKATLKRIAEEAGEHAVNLPISELLNPGGIDIDAGWYWLTLVYETNEGTEKPKEEVKKYLLFIRRETPYEIHARRVIIGNVPNADFVTLEEALLFCQPGNVLCLATGRHRVPKLIIAVPNISIESKDYQQPAIIRIGNIHVCDTWDIELSNLKFEGPYAFGRGNVVGFENSVLCKVTGCTFVATGINAENCDGVELSSNFFRRYAHNRGHITNSKRVILRNNTVHPVLKVYRVTNGSPAARAGLRSQDEIISVDGKPLGPNMNLSEAILAQKGKVLTLLVGRESNGEYTEVVITIKPQWEEKGNRYFYDLNIRPGGGAWGTFYLKNCQVVLALNNQLARSALHGLLLVGCADVLLAGNAIFQNYEGNIIIDYTHEAIICYNELVAGRISNISQFGSDRATVQHNVIRGSKVGIQLEKSGHSDYLKNLILENETGILCSAAAQNHVRRSIFLGNKQSIAGGKYYWGVITVEKNLMDSKLDPNSMKDTWLNDRNNTICAFELEETIEQGERFHIILNKADNYPNLDNHDYGPALSLKSKYLAICNNMASMTLEFSQSSEYLHIGKEFGDDLSDKMSDLANMIYSIGLPKVDEKSLGIHLEHGHREMLGITRSLAKLHIDDRRYDKAGPLLLKAMEGTRRLLGENHLRTLDCMNDLSWFYATCPVSKFRDVAKAVENSIKTCELANWKECRYVRTLAAAYAEAGDFDSAIKWQKKAIDLVPENKCSMWLADYESQLKLYQSGKCYCKAKLSSFSKGQMVGWWKFDKTKGKTVIDSTGNDLHGELVSNAHIISDPQRGNVLSLNGFDDYVHCGHTRKFDITEQITLAAWIKVNVFYTDWQAIITKGDSAWRLSRKASTNFLAFHCTGIKSSSDESWGALSHLGVEGTVDVNDGKWHHVAGVYDGKEIFLYVDGTLDNSEQASGLIKTNDFAVTIGQNIEHPARCWIGLMDDVRIYSYALNEAEVKEVYAGRGPGPNERPE